MTRLMARGPERGARRRGPGELEADVLAELWAATEPMSPTQVQAALPGELAYNTVHTILTRLCEKKLVHRDRTDTGSWYRPTKAAAELAAEQMRTAMGPPADHSAVLQHFITCLSADDERALRALLADADDR